MRVAFLLLCSGPSKPIVDLLQCGYFCGSDRKVYVHCDAKSLSSDFESIRSAAHSNGEAAVLEDRVATRWGEYSLVEATHRLVDAALADSFGADYFYLISESCVPIKPFEALTEFLEASGQDFIEAQDPTVKQWAIGGHEMDRLRRYYPFNFRTQRRLFELSNRIQDRIGIRRALPRLPIRFGAQWFCLRRETCRAISTKLTDANLVSRLRNCWIPDEFVFQTLATEAVSALDIADATLTYFEFNADGLPLILYNDHVGHLRKQPHFFARKRSADADRLLKMYMTASSSYNDTAAQNTLRPTGDFQLFQKTVDKRRPRIGGVDDRWWHPLNRNRSPYTVISGISRDYIRALVRKLAGWNVYDVHGYIFDTERIDLLDYPPGGPYTGDDIHIRNYQPLGFLYDVVNASDHECVFALDWNDLGDVISRVPYDQNCTVLRVNPPFPTTLEKLITRLTTEQAKAISSVAKDRRSDMIYDQFEHDDIGFWDRLQNEGYHCQIVTLVSTSAGVADGIRAAASEVDLAAVYSPAHQLLLNDAAIQDA